MSLGTDLAAAVALITTDSAYLRAIVQGPAGGAGSIVALPNGAQIKTLARIAQEVTGGYLPLAGGTLTGALSLVLNQNNNTDLTVSNPSTGAVASARLMLVGGTANAYAEFGVFENTGAPLGRISTGAAVQKLLFASNSHAFYTGGVERFAVAADGKSKFSANVGINIAPAVPFHLALDQNAPTELRAQNGTVGGSAGSVLAAVSGTANSYTRIGVFENAGAPIGKLECGSAVTAMIYSAPLHQFFGGHILFGSDGTQNVGGPSLRGANAYFTNGTILTSDGRQKSWLGYLRDQPGLLKVGLMIPEILGTFQFLSSIEEKGRAAWDALTPEQREGTTIEALGKQHARQHTGLTVQELVALFDTVRIEFPNMPTPAQLGLYGRDAVLTKVPREETRYRQMMVEQPFEEVAYDEVDGNFVERLITGTRLVPAPDIMKPVLMANGQPRLVQDGVRPTGIVDANGPVMQPNMVPMMRPSPQLEPYPFTVYDEVDLGEFTLSTRPDQIHYLCIGAAHLARKELEARVAVLEQAAI